MLVILDKLDREIMTRGRDFQRFIFDQFSRTLIYKTMAETMETKIRITFILFMFYQK